MRDQMCKACPKPFRLGAYLAPTNFFKIKGQATKTHPTNLFIDKVSIPLENQAQN